MIFLFVLSNTRPQPAFLWLGGQGRGSRRQETLDTYLTLLYNSYMADTKSVSIRFPLDLLETLKQLAQEDARSINGEVIWILRDYTQRRKGGKHEESIQAPPVSKRHH